MGGFVYLASAYTHPIPAIMEQRYLTARHALGYLLQQRIWAYSPIVHCHELAKADSLPVDHEFWKEYDETMIRAADRMLVLRSDGWELSKGIQSEVQFCVSIGKKWGYL